tara:strand:+ start:66 stop:290 length:225 start_codon:yes stop_codon:yes gene_type:complete
MKQKEIVVIPDNIQYTPPMLPRKSCQQRPFKPVLGTCQIIGVILWTAVVSDGGPLEVSDCSAVVSDGRLFEVSD